MPDKPLILTIDDDPDLAAIIALHVRRWDCLSHSVESAAGLWRFLEETERLPDVMLMDVMLGDADGSKLVAEVKDELPEVPVIMITRSTSVRAAVRCMKHGAADYITKPLDFARLRRAVEGALEVGAVARRRREEAAAPERGTFHGLVGASPAMRRLYAQIENVASTAVSVLILGETGTGKELVARAIHAASDRSGGPFVAVNAAAIPHELIESVLFGHEKGAFTGARQRHVGFCEQADGGTLFLDEISEMSFEVQAKLLRFLQDHVVQRVGSRDERTVDVRVVAATNVDPQRQIAARKLREDLYYRLRVVSLELPPLRRRPDDVALLAEHFLERFARRHGREFARLAPAARERLERYAWPGNVRELENLVEAAVVMHRGEALEADMLPAEVLGDGRPAAAPMSEVPEAFENVAASEAAASEAAALEASEAEAAVLGPHQRKERREVMAALERADGDPETAAAALGVSRATIYRRIKKYGLPGKRG